MSSLEYIIIYLFFVAVGIIGMVTAIKMSPGRLSGEARFRLGGMSTIVALAALSLIVVAMANGSNTTEGVAATVNTVEIQSGNQVILHLNVGESNKISIACGDDQIACRTAKPDDIVLYDVTTTPTGLGYADREIRFVTPGPQ